MRPSPIISVHIEKTGGSSVLKLLEDRVGADNVYNYLHETDKFSRLSDKRVDENSVLFDTAKRTLGSIPGLLPILQKVRRRISFVNRVAPGIDFSDIDLTDQTVLQGHFTPDMFRGLDIEPIMITVVREPLERMFSHYQHWKRLKGLTTFRRQPKYDRNMSFEDFAMLPENHNFQTESFGSSSFEDFAVVGVTERLDDFARRIGVRTKSIPKMNRAPKAKKLDLDQLSRGFPSRFLEVHQEDWELYVKAKHASNGKLPVVV